MALSFWLGVALVLVLTNHRFLTWLGWFEAPLSDDWLQQHAQGADKNGIDQSCINWDALTGRERR